MATPTSGQTTAYTTDVDVPYAVDCSPDLPPGAAVTAPQATFTNTQTGQPHPEMVVSTNVVGTEVVVVLTGLAVGQYHLAVSFAPLPPGAAGERLTMAPVVFTIPS